MFLNYNDFLNESSSVQELYIAKKISEEKLLAEFLNDAEEGKFPWIQISITPGAKSYVGVAINDGSSVSQVYQTTDPKVALVAITIKNTHRETPEEIHSVLSHPDDFLSYTIFAGDRPMTKKEVSKRYNTNYKIEAGDAVPYYISTPTTNQTY
mgnify:CR=1 FL=1